MPTWPGAFVAVFALRGAEDSPFVRRVLNIDLCDASGLLAAANLAWRSRRTQHHRNAKVAAAVATIATPPAGQRTIRRLRRTARPARPPRPRVLTTSVGSGSGQACKSRVHR